LQLALSGSAWHSYHAVHWSVDRPAQLEAQWVPAASAQQSFFSYHVDPNQGTLGLANGGGFQIVASEEISQPLSVRLFTFQRTRKGRKLMESRRSSWESMGSGPR
jgi:hypothetical protein